MLNHSDLIKLYFPKFDGKTPFASGDEEREAWLLFVDLLSALAFDELRDERQTLFARVGVRFVSADMVDILAPPDGDISSESEGLYSDALHQLYLDLLKKGFDENGAPLFPLSAVLHQMTSAPEKLAAVLAMASALSRKYEAVFSLLQDDDSDEGGRPTVGLCVDFCRFFVPEDERDGAALFDTDSFLHLCVLKKNERLSKKHGMTKPLTLKPVVKSILLGRGDALGALSLCAEGVAVPERAAGSAADDAAKGAVADADGRIEARVAGETICLQDTYEELKTVLSAGNATNVTNTTGVTDTATVIELSGAAGSGRRFLLSRAAAEFGKSVLAVDLKRYLEIADDDIREDITSTLIFRALTLNEIPYLWCAGEPTDYAGELRDLFSRLTARVPTVSVGAEKPISEGILSGAIFRITVPEISAKLQAVLWQEAAKNAGVSFADAFDIDVLVSKYVMSPARIFETMTNVAAAMRKIETAIIDETILEDQIRRSCSVQFGESATRLGSPFVWDDLMVSSESESLLRMAANRVRYRATVNEGFGFARKLPYGRGVAIVLYGPPGTGKTMAAQVLANDLGLDIYRIDLSQVSSKYIGETEKNLGAVFDAAKNSNAILFFDEADSLFAKRTEVSSSNDKYANAETSYLLQKIEEYSGVSVLATNNMQNFDAAFKRRMTFLIPIEAPDEATRIRLWEAVFPKDAPLDPSVNIRILAKVAEMTGSAIKSAAVTAAYLAAGENRSITYTDLVRAVDLEGIKAGTLGLGGQLEEAILAGE